MEDNELLDGFGVVAEAGVQELALNAGRTKADAGAVDLQDGASDAS